MKVWEGLNFSLRLGDSSECFWRVIFNPLCILVFPSDLELSTDNGSYCNHAK